MKRIPIKTATVVVFVLAALLSGYLFYKHLYIKGPDICSALFHSSCSGALSGSLSQLWGLPLGGWGLLYYLAILLLLLMPPLFGASLKKSTHTFIFLLTGIGLLTGVFLIGAMIVHPSLFCPLCLTVHLCNFALFFLFARQHRYGFRQFISTTRNAPRKKAGSALLWQSSSFLISGVFILSAFYGLKAYTLAADNAQRVNLKQAFADYDAQPQRIIPVDAGDPLSADTTGKLALVVFSDFNCPACYRFSAETDSVLKYFNSVCYVVFKQYPLCTNCNPYITTNIHPHSCEAAKASLAASRQGKFWEYHDVLFRQQDITNAAQKCGLQPDLFNAFRNSDTASAILQKNIQEGNSLGITGTPAVFLNGRQIKDTRPGVVEALITRTLQKARLASR
ncbi:MAG: DsbA family protein [Niabella sp.]|nr:DsbA family protein [Niabella sp.]